MTPRRWQQSRSSTVQAGGTACLCALVVLGLACGTRRHASAPKPAPAIVDGGAEVADGGAEISDDGAVDTENASVTDTTGSEEAGSATVLGPAVDADGTIDAEASYDPQRVTGIVVATGWGNGASGRKVVIGDKTTTTTSDGRFSFDGVLPKYNVIVVEPDGTQVSVYYGLTRRDPILSHTATYISARDNPPFMASVSGTLQGDFPFPLDANHLVTIYFLADRGRSNVQLSQFEWSRPGPDYGPLGVAWAGSSSLSGSLVALGQYGSAQRMWISASVGSAPLVLNDGAKATQDLVLAPVANGRIAGSVEMYPGNGVEAIGFGYHLPGARGLIGVGEFDTAGNFDCELPDLSTLGGEYCASIQDVWGHVQATRCGGAIGMTNFNIKVPAPPKFTSPVEGSPVAKNTILTWTSVANAVYMLDLGPEQATSTAPHIQAYLSGTGLAWPNLESIGVEFPADSTYTYRVAGLLPYASMDALASPSGLYATGVDSQVLDSQEIERVLSR